MHFSLYEDALSQGVLGGTDAEFEIAWPKLREQILLREIEAAPDNSTAAMSRRVLKGLY